MNNVRLSVLFLFACACTPTLAQLQYIPLATPCRAVDTRQAGGAIAGNIIQNFDPGRACGIPTQGNGPIVFATNVTVVPRGPLWYLTIWGARLPQPLASTLNSPDARVKSDYALVSGGTGGEVSVYVTNTTDVILDVSGYFVQAPPVGTSALLYTPVTPCRLLDTRGSVGPLGGSFLTAEKQRTFSVAGQCGLPNLTAGGALSVNVTAVPHGGLGYLSVWGTSASGNAAPATSTLNSNTGTVVANAAFLTINPSTNTSISAIASNDTDLVVDVTGYFSQSNTGMAYYPTTVPERIVDTRVDTNLADFVPVQPPPFTGGWAMMPTVGVATYVVNITVVPSGPLWYLTLWPDGIAQPLVSTLNSDDTTVTSNMAILSTGPDGTFDVWADGGPTQLIVDLSGSFMPRPASSDLVMFVGDEISAGLVANYAANHPTANWQCVNCLSTTTSTFAMSNLPAIIAMKPALVHIMVGAHELEGPGVNNEPANGGQVPLANIATMVTMLKAANIPLVIGDMPPCPGIDSYRFNIGLGADYTNESAFSPYPYVALEPLIAYSGIAPTPEHGQSPVCATGFDPNAAGYYLMEPLAEAAIDMTL